jgi:hypothetical protein
MRKPILLLVPILLLMLAACAGTGGQTSAGDAVNLLVTLSTNPVEPEVGRVELVVEVKDSANRPVDGAVVNLKADMIGHSMGDLSGQATEQGSGRYATTANLSMAGPWQIDVQVQAADHNVSREFRIEVK